MPRIAQRSQAGGEIAPGLYARTDVVKYQTGMRTLLNRVVKKYGGSENRAGTALVCEPKYSTTKEARQIPFIFNAENTYNLLFGDKYMRIIQDGGLVTVEPLDAWADSTSYAIGDLVVYDSDNYYCILGHTSVLANDRPGTGTNWEDYWYTMPANDIYEMPTPYLEADLDLLKYVQSGDVITITHPSYHEKDLTRYANTDWTLIDCVLQPGVTTPTNLAASGGSGTNYTYHVTAIDPETFEESLAGTVTASLADPSSTTHTVTWDSITGIEQYNVYLELNGFPGFIGIAGTNSFKNDGLDIDTTDSPPLARDPFDSTDNYPATCGYIQQRRVFANTNDNTEMVEMSKSGNFYNFSRSAPLQEDDAVSFIIAGLQVNAVKHIFDLNGMILMSSSGEWKISGDDSGTIRTGKINPRQMSYHGSSDVKPVLMGNTAIFAHSQNQNMFDLYTNSVGGYDTNDLTIFSSHLFKGRKIKRMCYQANPNNIVWVVFDDGELCGLTYLREQEILAWHRHHTEGKFKDVVCIPEGGKDRIYFIVERDVDGVDTMFVERIHLREITDIVDSVFLDCSLSYDGRNSTATTMTLTSVGGGWTYEDPITITSSEAFFSSDDEGNEIVMTGDSGGDLRLKIDTYTSDTVVIAYPHKDVTTGLQGVATTEWSKAVDSISGLEHLEGRNIGVFADGFVVASPNNASYDIVTVESGVATLDKPYQVIHAGISYFSDLETLDVDTIEGETLIAMQKLVTSVSLYVEETRGLFVGEKLPTGDDPLEGLYEAKLRKYEGYEDPVGLFTGPVNVRISSTWNKGGRCATRQVDPLPDTTLGIYPDVFIAK